MSKFVSWRYSSRRFLNPKVNGLDPAKLPIMILLFISPIRTDFPCPNDERAKRETTKVSVRDLKRFGIFSYFIRKKPGIPPKEGFK
jgi:hypothetical protein